MKSFQLPFESSALAGGVAVVVVVVAVVVVSPDAAVATLLFSAAGLAVSLDGAVSFVVVTGDFAMAALPVAFGLADAGAASFSSVGAVTLAS